MSLLGPKVTVMLDSDAALAFWCEKFGVTPFRLLQAVAAVGTSPRFVDEYLRG